MMRRCIGLLVAVAMMMPAAPASANDAKLDALIAQVQSMMEEMAKVQIQLLELKKDGLTTSGTASQISSSGAASAGSVLGATSFSFTEDLSYGVTNDDIFRVQQLLKTDSDIYPEGIVSGFFGPKTQDAIRNLQSRFGLDPVGVIGPATKALLERLLSERDSEGNFPSDILDPTRPTPNVLGVTSSAPSTTPVPVVVSTPDPEPEEEEEDNRDSDEIDRITAEYEDQEILVRVFYGNGSSDRYVFGVDDDDEDEAIEVIADELDLDEGDVEDWLKFTETESGDVDEIVVEFKEDEVKVEVEFDDGDDDSFTIDETDYDDVIEEIADELDIDEDEVEKVLVFDIDIDDIDEIEVTVFEDEDDAEVEIKFEDDDMDDIEFTIEAEDEDDEDEMIEALAEKLDLDEDEVEDVTDFSYKD